MPHESYQFPYRLSRNRFHWFQQLNTRFLPVPWNQGTDHHKRNQHWNQLWNQPGTNTKPGMNCNNWYGTSGTGSWPLARSYSQKEAKAMTDPSSIPVSDLDGEQRMKAIIRRDQRLPRRVYCNFPPFTSLTPEEAIAVANRIADVLEEMP